MQRSRTKIAILLVLGSIAGLPTGNRAQTAAQDPAKGQANATVPELLAKARQLLSKKSVDEALALYQEIVDHYPDSPHIPRALLGLGDCYERRGEILRDRSEKEAKQAFRQAIPFYTKVADLKENRVEGRTALFRLSFCYEQLEEWGNALQALERLVQRFGNEEAAASAYGQMGSIYRRMGQPEKAAVAYQKVLENYPDYDNRQHVYRSLANCYKEIQPPNWEMVILTYEQCLKEFPEMDEDDRELVDGWLEHARWQALGAAPDSRMAGFLALVQRHFAGDVPRIVKYAAQRMADGLAGKELLEQWVRARVQEGMELVEVRDLRLLKQEGQEAQVEARLRFARDLPPRWVSGLARFDLKKEEGEWRIWRIIPPSPPSSSDTPSSRVRLSP